MRLFIAFTLVFLTSIASQASQNLSCVAGEDGMDLQYVTILKDLSENDLKSLEIGFLTNKSDYHRHCISDGSLTVRATSAEILTVSGRVTCIDGTGEDVELKLNLMTMELDNGLRVQKCKPQYVRDPI